ncbi:hypothetical protein ACI3KT_16255 [Microbacterium sp. ZW T6_19]|uniref:hypothetical protein n=1 Tax=Microbacterium sp. ZW T6_19 TaxID=3378082 RepID=UPI003854D5C6
MTPIPEPDELRALQHKAYGRGGGLTDAEAARLRELEQPEPPRVDSPDAHSRPDPRSSTDELPAVERGSEATEAKHVLISRPQGTDVSSRLFDSTAARSTTDAREAAEEPSESTSRGARPTTEELSWRPTLRRHWKAVAAASALLLIFGLGAGWALFAPRVRDAVALTEDEVQHKLELDEKYEFDEGTLRAVARDDDALVWFGTQSDGDQNCLVLEAAGQSQIGCARADDVNLAYGLNATISLPPEEDAAEGDFGASINAYGMLSTAGEPMVAIQRWDNDASMLDQFEGDERTRAQALIDEGYLAGVSLVGYVREQPAWIAYRFTDSDQNERCLIVDALGATACGLDSDTLQDGLTLTAEDENGRIEVSAQFTNWGTPYLTITENAGGASTIVIDTETGDPIEVTDPDG